MGYAGIMVAVDAEEGSRDRVRMAGHLADLFAARLIGVAAERPDYGLFTTDPGAGGPYVLPVLHENCLERMRRAESPVRGGRRRAQPAGLALRPRRPAAVPPGAIHGRRPRGDRPAGAGQPGRTLRHRPRRRGDAERAPGPHRAAGPFLLRHDPHRHRLEEHPRGAARGGRCDAAPAPGLTGRGLPRRGRKRPRRGGRPRPRAGGQGIEASAARTEGDGAATAEALVDLACEHAAGLLVAGAYGHSRLSEWAFGGVTRDLMRACPLCCLMSH